MKELMKMFGWVAAMLGVVIAGFVFPALLIPGIPFGIWFYYRLNRGAIR